MLLWYYLPSRSWYLCQDFRIVKLTCANHVKFTLNIVIAVADDIEMTESDANIIDLALLQ